MMALPAVANAHDPADLGYDFTCALGEPSQSQPGSCFVHHANADAYWRMVQVIPTAAKGEIRNGYNVWDLTDGHQFNYIESSTTGMYVYWDTGNPCGNASFIACAHIEWSSGHIVESSSYSDFESDQPWSTDGTPSSSEYDLRSAASHEAGHLVGLGHGSNYYATMYATVTKGSTFRRTLHNDDKFGRCQIYGHSHAQWGGCSIQY